MTTAILPRAIHGVPDNNHATDTNLLDRFWDAFFLEPLPKAFNNDKVPHNRRHKCRGQIIPTIDIKTVEDQPKSFTATGSISQKPVDLEPQLHPSLNECFILPSEKPSLRSRCTSRLNRRPKLSIQSDLKPNIGGIKSPATAILNLASNFLDDIMKVTRTQSPTANTMVIGSPEGDIQVVESEVHINVIDEDKRAGVQSALELQDSTLFERLDIPSVPTLTVSETSFDVQTPNVVDGPAESARELDAFLQMSWERQLSNANAPFWH